MIRQSSQSTVSCVISESGRGQKKIIEIQEKLFILRNLRKSSPDGVLCEWSMSVSNPNLIFHLIFCSSMYISGIPVPESGWDYLGK